MSGGEELVGEFESVRFSTGGGAVDLCIGDGFEDGLVDGFPGIAEGFVGLEVEVGFVADGEAVEGVGIVFVDVFGEAGGVGGVAIFEAEGVDDLCAGFFGEVEEGVDVFRVGDGDFGIVDGVGADAQALDAEGLVDADEVFVVGVEIVFAVFGDDNAHFVAAAEEERGDVGGGGVGGEGDGDGFGRGCLRGGLSCAEAEEEDGA